MKELQNALNNNQPEEWNENLENLSGMEEVSACQ
jgi:hypothetical protein